MLTRLFLPILTALAVLAQAAITKAEVVSVESGDQHFIKIVQANSLVINGQAKKVYEIQMCEVMRRETCGILGSRAYSADEVEKARASLVKDGWLGVGAGAVLVIGGSAIGMFALPAAYLATATVLEGGAIMIPILGVLGMNAGAGAGYIATKVYLNPMSRFAAAEVLTVKAIQGQHVAVDAKISDMAFLIDKTFRSLEVNEFGTVQNNQNLKKN